MAKLKPAISWLINQSRPNQLAMLVFVVMMVFVGRAFYLQVIRYDHFIQVANQNQTAKFKLPAERGAIYAMSRGETVPLVLNQTVYLMFADPHEVEDVAKLKQAVKRVAGGNLIDGSLSKLDNDELRYVVLAREISRKQAELLKQKHIAGLGFKKSSTRVYPEGSLAATVLGFVGADGEGKYGVEQYLDEKLSGRPGLLKTVTDVRNIPLTIGENDIRRPPVDGKDIVLSIDRNIQAKVEAALEKGLKAANATRGSVIVMDPDTGKIWAMANRPSYHPGKYAQTENYAAFTNDVVSSPYAPGSVMKTLSMGAAIASGAITKNSTFINDNVIKVNGVKITNAIDFPYMPNANVVDILHYSLNTGVVWALKQMGGGEINEQARQTLYHYYHDLYRLGQITGVEQAGERAGVLYKPNQGYGEAVRYANMMYGQGMQVTMVQVASAFSALINGGTYYQPSVVKGILKDNGEIKQKEPIVVEEQIISRHDSKLMRRLIWKASEAGHFGDASPEGYMVAGKTGTAQKINPKTGEFSTERVTGSYLGFGGTMHNPEYVIMVRVMDPNLPGFAGTEAAAPIFYNISNWLIKYLRLEPSK